ncbi:hypothetical protein Nepgr_026918 [Nepenthes gracilis]|uniref:Phosphatidylinositol 4-phosphate 5-kinase n=1 Tax=Nepenthes gracilis TaxID=150966 RepID=A0AAD3T8X7_NEPGR|nr:hypothetical protein Nepgr_026918 [Nepenthes gracilis]
MEMIERPVEKVFPNGDVYYGDYLDALPHGRGKYTWSDGTVYEGEWEEGKMTGKGCIVWPSGFKYEGDFSGGYLHGCGTFTASDGSAYHGAWMMNFQHGAGRKQYSSSDIYEGQWKEGVREGNGKYIWNSGNTYIGTWKSGKMSGRGVMKWINGDLFYGFWLDGLRHGSGFYMFADGGYYLGTWTRGLKDGRGKFYPAGSKHPSLKRWSIFEGYDGSCNAKLPHASSMSLEESMDSEPGIKRSLSEKLSIGSLLRTSDQTSHWASSDKDRILRDLARELSSQDISCKSCDSNDDQCELQGGSSVVFEREYMQGVLIRERIRKSAGKLHNTKQQNKFSAKEVKRSQCIKIFRGNRSHCLMLNLQLGIRYTVGKITPVPAREVRSADFCKEARIKMNFPRKGSQITPPHCSIDFHWKDYCPMVFRNLREMFKLDAADYMMSICGDDGLRELSSPGKSGSIFYLSHDDRFVIKTLRKSEVKVLLKMLHRYYEHVQKHENTLITKFFGLHSITLKGGRKVRFVVMGNMFYTELRIHRRYDLKGSSEGRFTNPENISENITLKDLDLAYEFYMDRSLRESLFEQILLDCMFLESQQIIDYSLLLGLHFRAPENLKPLLEPQDTTTQNDENKPAVDASLGELPVPPTGLLLVTHEPSSVNTAPGPHIRGSTLKAYSAGDREVDLLLPGTGRLRVQLGVNMPAQANRKLPEGDSTEVELFEVYDVVLYLGIIDILQDYSMRKKIEHAYKSMQYDPRTISAVDPELYSRRFINFLERVFPDP